MCKAGGRSRELGSSALRVFEDGLRNKAFVYLPSCVQHTYKPLADIP